MRAELHQDGQLVTLKRSLRYRDLILYGIVLIQPTAPMPVFGVIYQESRGHVLMAILFALSPCCLPRTAMDEWRELIQKAARRSHMSAKSLHPSLGYMTGWCMAMDYILNPLICTIWCSRAAMNFAPSIPYVAWVLLFAALFTALNLRGVEDVGAHQRGSRSRTRNRNCPLRRCCLAIHLSPAHGISRVLSGSCLQQIDVLSTGGVSWDLDRGTHLYRLRRYIDSE